MLPGPTLDDAAAKQRATTPPWPVILLAIVVGLLLVPATTFGGYLLVTGQSGAKADQPTRNTAAPDVPLAGATPAPLPDGDWRAVLRAQTCSVPCVGGWACPSKPLACTSGLTCIPGTGGDRFTDDETWTLHLSAVQELGPGGALVDPCKTQKDFWVCRSGTTVCASQADACANASISTAAIPVSGAEIAHDGLSLEVRDGSPGGPLLAKTENVVDLRTLTDLCCSSAGQWRPVGNEMVREPVWHGERAVGGG